jgi:YVTN family beta-propeller protein
MRSHRRIALTILSLLLAASAAGAQIGGPKEIKQPAGRDAGAKAPHSFSSHFEKEGINIEFSIEAVKDESGRSPGLVAGADAVVSFRVKDKRTGEPVTGLHPSAWINARSSDYLPGEAECRDKIKTLMGGLLSVRADIDLNSYLMLTLNHDSTITFINPQVAFNITKLESIVTLPGVGVEMALSKDGNYLYVTMPEKSAVAVINTVTRKIVGVVSTGEKTRPTRISIQPDGKYAWVALDGSPSVAVVETTTNKLAATVGVGAGLHNIAFTPDSRFAYVTNSESDTVSAIDTASLKQAAEIGVGKTPVALAYSSAGGLIYVAAVNGGTVSVIRPDAQQVIKTIPLKQGLVAMRFEPEGRYGFVVNQVESTVSIIDAATNTITGKTGVVKGPDQVVFTKRYAYVRGTESEKFSLLELSEIAKKGTTSPVSIQAGRQPASALPQEIGVADMIAPTPEGNAAMIANAPDRMIYYYVEGMMAPMGTFQNYKRRPYQLLLINRSLSETGPGIYSVPIKLRDAGRFDVPLIIDQPRLINCFDLQIAESPESKAKRGASSIAVEALFKGKQFKTGEPYPIRFRLTDSVTGQPLTLLADVQVMVFEPPGVWQQRQDAREIGDGIYEVIQTFPNPGIFNVMISVQSRGARFADTPHTRILVKGGDGGQEKKGTPGAEREEDE